MKHSCAVILAAGEGRRMQSEKPKALHEILFRPMLDWVIGRVKESGITDICIVTGHKTEQIRSHLGDAYETVFQADRLGTGHAVLQAKDFITRHGNGDVLVLNGDAPFIDCETIAGSFENHTRRENSVTVISARLENPKGCGRIIRNEAGAIERVVSDNNATMDEKMICEVGSGAYWFGSQALLSALENLENRFEEGLGGEEFSLTSAVETIIKSGLNAGTFEASTPDAALGVNDKTELFELNEKARISELKKHMLSGVTIPCADGIIISPGITIGQDTTILPGTIIRGESVIGKNCVIGPNTVIDDSIIGDGVCLSSVCCDSSKVGSSAQIGPYVRIRPGSEIGENVKIGNFVEIKNAEIGDETKVSHLSYIGDAEVGKGVNFGSGCATVNYSGKEKNKTIVEDGAFIGCDSQLIAPVTIGERAYTAAGSIITENVPPNALAIARARQTIKKDWVLKKKPYRK